MADTWWFEETKLLIALWSEEAVQHELNTMHNKKLVWDKISQGIADEGYSRSAQQCRVKINNLKQKYRKIRDGNKISGNQQKEREMFEPMDHVLGCKQTSKPRVVVDSMPSSSKEDEKISKVTYPDDGDEAFGSVVDVSFSSLFNDDENVAATPKEKSRCAKTTDISLVKNPNIASKDGIEHVSTQPSTSTKDPKFTGKKRKKPCKGDKISEALSTFAEVQREQQQLFMEMEERQAQNELELEEKRMKLEQENDQRRKHLSCK